MSVISASGARKVIDAAVAAAERQGLTLSIPMRDLTGAFPVSVDSAILKAKSAARMGMPTTLSDDILRSGNLAVSSISGVPPLGGGVAVLDADGAMIGPIGVSGATLKADVLVAKTGAEGSAD